MAFENSKQIGSQKIKKIFDSQGFIFFGYLFIGLCLAIFSWIKSSLLQDPTFPAETVWLRFVFLAVNCLFVLVYFWGAKRLAKTTPSLKAMLIFSGLFGFLLLFIKPSFSADLYNNLLQGRIAAVYHFNPYQVMPSLFGSDQLSQYIGWPNLSLVYGPLQLFVFILLAKIAGPFIWLGLLLYKLFNLIIFWLSGFLVYLILEKIDPPNKQLGLYLWLYNPLLLFQFVVEGHNDVFFLFFIFLALYAALRQQKLLSLVYLFCSVFIKYISCLLFPLWLLYFYRQSGKKESLYRSRWVIWGAVAVVLFLFAPLGFRLDFLNGLQKQVGFFSLVAISFPAQIVALVASWLFSNKLPWSIVFVFIKIGLVFLFGLYYLKRLKYVWQNPRADNLIKFSGDLFWGYLLICAFWLMGWYFAWPIAFWVLLPKQRQGLLYLATLFGFAGGIFFDWLLVLVVWLLFILWFWPNNFLENKYARYFEIN